VLALERLQLKLVGFALGDVFAPEFALILKFVKDLFLALFRQIRSLAYTIILVIALLLSLLERTLKVI